MAKSTKDPCRYLATKIYEALTCFNEEWEGRGSMAIFPIGRELGWSIAEAADSILMGWKQWSKANKDIKVTQVEMVIC